MRSSDSRSPLSESLPTTNELLLKVLALMALKRVMVSAAAALWGVRVGVTTGVGGGVGEASKRTWGRWAR